MDLTLAECAFLRSHNYRISDVFDGRGMGKTDRKEAAKRAGCELILVASCTAGFGHRLTSRSGHCFQCSPKRKSFEKKHGRSGYVYIAASITGRLIKIGTTKDLASRERTLCSEPYANLCDWRIVASVWVDKSGDVEDRTLARLVSYRVDITSVREGQNVLQKEVRRCTFEVALNALTAEVDVVVQNEISIAKNWKVFNW
jgi:hypothetical protein